MHFASFAVYAVRGEQRQYQFRTHVLVSNVLKKNSSAREIEICNFRMALPSLSAPHHDHHHCLYHPLSSRPASVPRCPMNHHQRIVTAGIRVVTCGRLVAVVMVMLEIMEIVVRLVAIVVRCSAPLQGGMVGQ